MDKLSDKLNLTPSTERSNESRNGSVKMAASSLMAKLWVRMVEMYGQKFSSTYGEEPNQTWAQALAGFSGEEIADGLRACFHRADTWPPSLPEFVQMCRPQPDKHAPYHKAHLALPPPRANKDFAREQLAKMREKL